jgi:hypothetical protein
MSEHQKIVAVVPIQPILSSEPEKSLLVLDDKEGRKIGESLLGPDVVEFHLIGLGEQKREVRSEK